MSSLPMPLRAALGLVATAVDEARRLPDRAIEIPMLAVSTALQLSLRAQQHYAELAARGDALLEHQTVGDEPPEWATFDDPVATGTDVPDDATPGEPDGATPAEPGSPEPGARAPRPRPNTAKSVPRPRHIEPSPFDTVDDD